MNNLKIIVYILFIGTLNISCEEAEDDGCGRHSTMKEITYNKSNHNIVITSWFNGAIKDIYSLAIDESITKFGGLLDPNLFLVSLVSLDSMSIIFDNNKKLFLRKEILGISNGITTYSKIIEYDNESALEGGGKCDRLCEFSFTEEHYNNAENCNGICD